MESVEVFQDISDELSRIWNYSHIPVILDPHTFSELTRTNELALKIITNQYKEGHYENMDHPFTRKVASFSDPEVSIVPFRIDYLKNKNGTYTMYDLNTQPGVPGSFFWEELASRGIDGGMSYGGKDIGYYRIFPVMGKLLRALSGDGPKMAMYQGPDPTMGEETVKGLTTICEKASSYGHYQIDFVQKKEDLGNYPIIEPFYFIRGDMNTVFSNFKTALKTGKPLASNLKLEPYTSKDMAFASDMQSYLGSLDADFLGECIAWPSEDGPIKKRLYGMSGTGFYDGDDSVPFSDELVCQDELFPDMCPVSINGKTSQMMYDVGITSLMVFKGQDMVELKPVVDITIRAKERHPISGPDTHVVPGAVEI